MSEPPRIADEIKKMQAEPLARAEKVMILVSLGLGVLLLVGFVVLSRITGSH